MGKLGQLSSLGHIYIVKSQPLPNKCPQETKHFNIQQKMAKANIFTSEVWLLYQWVMVPPE